jgi:glucose-fructose oxidoreductase
MKPAFAYAEPLKYTMTVGEREVTRKGKKHDQFAAELLYFSDCVRQDRDPEPSGEEGLRDVRIVNAIYQSAGTGEPVDLPPLIPEPGPARDQAISQPPVREPELVRVDKPHD